MAFMQFRIFIRSNWHELCHLLTRMSNMAECSRRGLTARDLVRSTDLLRISFRLKLKGGVDCMLTTGKYQEEGLESQNDQLNFFCLTIEN